jgi:hypothetical protein
MMSKQQLLHQREHLEAIKSSTTTNVEKTVITYDFYDSFHPYVGKIIEQLSQNSLAGIFNPEFQAQFTDDFLKPYGINGEDDTLIVKNNTQGLDFRASGPYAPYNWELFFHVPFAVAVYLSKNQRYKEAQRWFHFIFDPTSTDTSVPSPARFWKFNEFRASPAEMIDQLLASLSDTEESEMKTQVINSINSWQRHPFQPHVVAKNRLVAYQLNVVMKYLDNLIAWGDSLFLQDSIETINEATQIYILAVNILGQKPQKIRRLGKVRPVTYAMIGKKLDEFGNAMVEMEGEFPMQPGTSSSAGNATSQTGVLFGMARTLYFTIPQNDTLLGYWDLVGDRLFKIRHCMNIAGQVRQLPLFQPPIDPGMLVKAAAAGIDISSVVSGLNAPISLVRTQLMIQKALEACMEVKALGGALTSALEKKDAEKMAQLRQGYEINVLELAADVKYLQWKDAEAATEALLKTRATTFQRFRHYQMLLGKKDQDLADVKSLTLERKELTSDNFDEVYGEMVTKYSAELNLENYRKDKSSVDSGALTQALGSGDGANLQLNGSESKELNTLMPQAHDLQLASSVVDTIASVLALIPEASVDGTPMGVGGEIAFGGRELSTFVSAEARILRIAADDASYQATRASKLAGYQRRIEDWVLQSNLAASELTQIGRQIISSMIREQISKADYNNHMKQIEKLREIDDFLNSKFTNADLYNWMQGEISKVYYDSYKFAFDIAKKAEKTMKYELMRQELDDTDFIKFNYWDNGRKGLLSGEALYLDLKRMEMAYHDYNKREYEMVKHVSLQQLDPNALLKLKATGSCEVTIPEWLYDMDCPGHYMRRIKTVSLSIPCVTGPYTSINCTLALTKSTLRISPIVGSAYKRSTETDDIRFRDFYGTIQSVVTSSAQNDSGLFETNLRDERFLPFEGAGAESTWKLDLPADVRQYDYDTISDVILHVRYTAREGGDLLKTKAVDNLIGTDGILTSADSSVMVRSFSLNHEFPVEWQRFMASLASSAPESLRFTIRKEHFPYFTRQPGKNITIGTVELFSIKDRALSERIVTGIDFSDLNSATDGNKCDITIAQASNDSVLDGDKEAEVFLVLSYTLG